MTSLSIGAREVAQYCDGQEMPAELSPRPYLHPVRTLAGQPLTEVAPADHRHHYGVSNAVVEINGSMFWGGGSYVHPSGYQLLDNHGRQVGGPVQATAHAIDQQVEFLDVDGRHLLTEQRRLTAELLPAWEGWALSWHSRLLADSGDLTFGSPATRGRVGAGYGGLFWRISGDQLPTTAQVDGGGEPLGSTSPWLLLTQDRPAGPVSLLLAQPHRQVLPWFVRTGGYVGAGPAVAWEAPRRLAHGEQLDLHLTGVLFDRVIDTDSARTLYTELEQLS